MAFQAEQKIKADILRGLSTEQLFQLLSDSDVNVLMKTLGLLRNLLSTRPVSKKNESAGLVNFLLYIITCWELVFQNIISTSLSCCLSNL